MLTRLEKIIERATYHGFSSAAHILQRAVSTCNLRPNLRFRTNFTYSGQLIEFSDLAVSNCNTNYSLSSYYGSHKLHISKLNSGFMFVAYIRKKNYSLFYVYAISIISLIRTSIVII